MIDAQHWHARWKGRPRPMMQFQLGILQSCRQSSICNRPTHSVKVAQQDNRIPTVEGTNPAGAEQRVNLYQTLGCNETQVRGYDLDLGFICLNRSPKRAAGFERRAARQAPSLNQTHRQRRQDGVAVELLLDLQCRMEVKAHCQRVSDGMGLVYSSCTNTPDIEFLERYDVRLAAGDHLGDSLWLRSSVCADASVHVVGHDAWHYDSRRLDICVSLRASKGRLTCLVRTIRIGYPEMQEHDVLSMSGNPASSVAARRDYAADFLDWGNLTAAEATAACQFERTGPLNLAL